MAKSTSRTLKPHLRRPRKQCRIPELSGDLPVGAFGSSGGRTGGARRMIFASIFAVTGATLVLTSGNPHASDASPRHLRKLAVDSTSASPDRSEMEFAPGIVNTVHKLAAPFLEDQTNIFVFDEIDTRPIINTFFAIQDGQTISDVDAKMLAVWKQAWSGAGWNPVSIAYLTTLIICSTFLTARCQM